MKINKKHRVFIIFAFNIIVITSEIAHTNVKYNILYILYKYYYTIA